MSDISIEMSRYIGRIPSLYDSLDYRAVALLEIAIYNRELVFYAKALPIFRNGPKKWLDVPIVLDEYAQTFLRQETVKDAGRVLSTYLATVNGDGPEKPEMRLLTLSLAFEETCVFGHLERAVEEVDKLWSSPVDESGARTVQRCAKLALKSIFLPNLKTRVGSRVAHELILRNRELHRNHDSLLKTLVPKPGGRLALHVVKRLEDALRDPEAIINKTYI
ncbi:hypothetical protein BGZ57DRAFT_861666 [Hyaloscypha finlandica]|nr:hypothetical protein BGZ57DRAFT_861666 [Hyaloscypha finlandica]